MKYGLILCLLVFLGLPTTVLATDVDDVVNASNQFAIDLYKQYSSSDENIFFSPYSISTALAMTYEGAEGKTADEIKGVFHFPERSILRTGSDGIYQQLNSGEKEYTLSTANALWAERTYQFLDSYLDVVNTYYHGEVTNLDFINNPESSRITINKWVEEQTREKIKNLLPAGVIDSLTRLVLTNAVYFKGDWMNKFKQESTRPGTFSVSKDEIIQTSMMHQRANFKYYENDLMQAIELPYKGNELSMIILLPTENNIGIAEGNLTIDKFLQIKNALKDEEVDLTIPKFKFDTKYFMKDTLSAMGMPTAFDEFAADFSGMNGFPDLYISKVIHQAFIQTDEEGSEAAAATAVVMSKRGMSPKLPNYKIFKADHPFVFLIQHRYTGNILFMGRLTRPEKIN